MGMVIVSLAGGTLLFGPGVLAAFVARHKGYRPWFWLLSAGPFGALLILLKPNLKQATTPEERERWEARTDLAGGILSGFTLFGMCGILLLGVVAFATVRVVPTAALPPGPPMISKVAILLATESVEPTDDSTVQPADAEFPENVN